MTKSVEIKEAIANQEAKLKDLRRILNKEGLGLMLVNYERGKLAGMRDILSLLERNA